ncbi:hypothetical protein BDR06DRAFT_954545 [Suillus hirtellus]|nr:hypothetical protein BDR06DRAFT_954545 [Suillus hirtellus]
MTKALGSQSLRLAANLPKMRETRPSLRLAHAERRLKLVLNIRTLFTRNKCVLHPLHNKKSNWTRHRTRSFYFDERLFAMHPISEKVGQEIKQWWEESEASHVDAWVFI